MTRQQRILQYIFEKPVRSDIKWDDVISLVKHLGREIQQRKGSRVALVIHQVSAIFHTPHPRKEMKKAAVVELRKFLEKVGVHP
ncbi:MAG: type II toxin-antitoxin system HicA family toxin [Candidatus Omnitrophota bacterium]|jgi:hypothetical protein|nr:MAG: type II toxin-antitoxin system HicA family toxin [Candidatus Omnitrophota bacterium]